jgi:hypothetical protein
LHGCGKHVGRRAYCVLAHACCRARR